jgi:hypothetical protein
MNRSCRETIILLRFRAGPVRLEVSAAEEKQGEKISDHPCNDNGNHEPIRPTKLSCNTLRKHTAVEKEKAQFDAG